MHCARVASGLGRDVVDIFSCHRCRHKHTYGVVVATARNLFFPNNVIYCLKHMIYSLTTGF
jgi:hypothetical protein